jgi:chaperonin GroES
MNYNTTGNRVIIEREPTETKTSSGFIIPTVSEVKNYYGYVLGVGPGKITRKKVRIEPTVKVGDKVLFDPAGAISITADGRDLLIIKEDDIVSVVDANVGRGI